LSDVSPLVVPDVPDPAQRDARAFDPELLAFLALVPVLAQIARASSAGYNFSVGCVDLSRHDSAFAQQISSRGFSLPINPSTSSPGRKPRPPESTPAHWAFYYALQEGSILVPCDGRPHFVCPHFFVPKGSKLRLIFDGRVLNAACPPPPPFRSHGIKTCKGRARRFCWAAKLDIRHCFYNVPLDPAIQRFFTIQLPDRSFWSFTRLPMGFAWSSYVIARLLRLTLRPLGERVTFYADDIVVWGSSEVECLANLFRVRRLLLADGWTIHDAKTTLPTQHIDILGVAFNLVDKSCRLSAGFVGAFLLALARVSGHRHLRRRTLASVFGSVCWGSVALPALLPLANPICTAVSATCAWDALVCISPAVVVSLRALAAKASENPWCSFRSPRAGSPRFWSDASDDLLGVCHPGGTYTRLFSAEERLWHIDDKEALALLRSFAMAWELRSDAFFLVDSKPLYGACQKGRSNNPLFSACCAYLARVSEAGLAWVVDWVPTKQNPADVPTRPNLLGLSFPPATVHPEFLPFGYGSLVPHGWASPRLSQAFACGAYLAPVPGSPEFAPCDWVVWPSVTRL
jgi:hypothetical protein